MTRKVKFTVTDGDSGTQHSCSYESVDLWCPGCGTKGTVWRQSGGGDYYVGQKHLCTNCCSSFYFPDGMQPAGEDSIEHTELEALKAAPAAGMVRDEPLIKGHA